MGSKLKSKKRRADYEKKRNILHNNTRKHMAEEKKPEKSARSIELEEFARQFMVDAATKHNITISEMLNAGDPQTGRAAGVLKYIEVNYSQPVNQIYHSVPQFQAPVEEPKEELSEKEIQEKVADEIAKDGDDASHMDEPKVEEKKEEVKDEKATN